MKREISIVVGTLAVFAFVSSAAAQSGGGYELTWHTIDGGGEMYSTGGGYVLGGTIAQPDAGRLSNGNYVVNGGFWHPQPSGCEARPEPDIWCCENPSPESVGLCHRNYCDPQDPDADENGCVCVDILYGDVYPVPGGDGAAEGFDILCILDAANADPGFGCLDVLCTGLMAGDIYPCGTGDGAVEGFDILAVLDAANAIDWCPPTCVCP